MSILVTLGALLAFVAGSIFYVYRIRGTVRYDSFKQYVRKGWPLFAPLNCLLYLFTDKRARRPIPNRRDFAELDVVRDNWRIIRAEACALHEQQMFERTCQPGSKAYYDIGFRTFYKYGWSKFYLKWYGTTHNSAQNACPQTLRVLEQVPRINGAMFSVLPVGGKLTPHADPVACSLRYHLGLATPNADACYINIDGSDYSWRDGDDLLFDETYLHYAHNDAEQDRLILMCDFERPTWGLGRVINRFYKALMGLTVVPNTEADHCGLANRFFAWLSPALANIRALKESRPGRYKAIKYSVNASLMLLVAGLAVGAILAIQALATISV